MRKTAVLSVAVAGALGLAMPALAQKANDFVQTAIKGDNSEIMLGQLGEKKCASPQCRKFAQMLVTDHTAAKAKAAALAQKLGVKPDDGATLAAQTEKLKLQALNGKSFDSEFAHYMVNDHRRDLDDFTKEAKARTPASKLASATLPALHKHLEAALRLEQQTAG